MHVPTSNRLPEVKPTNEAARHINRRPQTLRKWACLENGPIDRFGFTGVLRGEYPTLKRCSVGSR